MKKKNLKMVCLTLAIMLMAMTFMSATVLATDTKTIIPEDDALILCHDCEYTGVLIIEENINETAAVSCTSPFGHSWVWDSETMSYNNTSNASTYCYLREIYKRDFERCTRCGVKTASTYYYWKIESKYHTWSGNTCTSCGYKK